MKKRSVFALVGCLAWLICACSAESADATASQEATAAEVPSAPAAAAGETVEKAGSSGSCLDGCILISANDLRGQCCFCNNFGAGAFVRSAWSPKTYLCKK